MTSQLSVSKTVNSCATAFAEVEAKLNKVTEKVDESISKVDVNSGCRKCDHISSTKENLKLHEKYHHRGPMYVCDLCQKKKYPGKSGLLVHIESVHGNYCKFMEEMDKK